MDNHTYVSYSKQTLHMRHVVTDPELAEEEELDLENEEVCPIPFMRAKRNKIRPKWLNNYQVLEKLQ